MTALAVGAGLALAILATAVAAAVAAYALIGWAAGWWHTRRTAPQAPPLPYPDLGGDVVENPRHPAR